jgi:hypothetical protein
MQKPGKIKAIAENLVQKAGSKGEENAEVEDNLKYVKKNCVCTIFKCHND